MSEHTKELQAAATSVLSARCELERIDAAVDKGYDLELWQTLEQLGLTLISVPESAGGSGGSVAELASVLGPVGEYSGAIPLAETALLAGWLIATAGKRVPVGPMTGVQAPADFITHRDPNGTWRLDGRLDAVGWGGAVAQIALVLRYRADEFVVCLDPDSVVTTSRRRNLAGERRDSVQVSCIVPADRMYPVPAGTYDELSVRAALGRAVLLAGASERALALTLRYTNERRQFGRAISAFQAVQHELARIASEVVLTSAAVSMAVATADRAGFADPATWFAVWSAKGQASQAASVIAKTAHQLHGAMGFTHEHPLRLSTMRLWAWRDEDGSQWQCFDRAGRDAIAATADGLWPMLTSTGSTL
jgi:acyl-CoA dehydrogenase